MTNPELILKYLLNLLRNESLNASRRLVRPTKNVFFCTNIICGKTRKAFDFHKNNLQDYWWLLAAYIKSLTTG